MNDAEFEEQRDRLLPLIESWVGPLGLGWWHIEVVYVRDEFEIDGKPAPKTLASCRANWRYLTATIEWNMARVATQDDDELERAFVHELCHIFVNEMRESDNDDWLDHEERVASTLAAAFVWLRDSFLKGEHSDGNAPEQASPTVHQREEQRQAVDREDGQGGGQEGGHQRGQPERREAGQVKGAPARGSQEGH